MEATIETYGTAGLMDSIPFQGKTDMLILYESLKPDGFSEDQIKSRIKILKKNYFSILQRLIQQNTVDIMPGIPDVLEALSPMENVALGLLTGNFSDGARIKLSSVNLFEYFDIGVFGDDTDRRNDMPEIARRRINRYHNTTINFSDIFIIGDTQFDIECAQKSGAQSIAVGTGWTEEEDLLSCNPDFYFKDLRDTRTVIDTIFN
jgi:phosphoglycolate phosphatase